VLSFFGGFLIGMLLGWVIYKGLEYLEVGDSEIIFLEHDKLEYVLSVNYVEPSMGFL